MKSGEGLASERFITIDYQINDLLVNLCIAEGKGVPLSIYGNEINGVFANYIINFIVINRIYFKCFLLLLLLDLDWFCDAYCDSNCIKRFL